VEGLRYKLRMMGVRRKGNPGSTHPHRT